MEKRDPLLQALTFLQAGAWDKAHTIAQEDESPFACWLHGIVHIVEGDLSNASYWYRRAGRKLPRSPDVTVEIAALRDALEAEKF